jgi:hypothetical protein
MKRVAAVTGGLIVAGGIAGAVVSALAVGLSALAFALLEGALQPSHVLGMALFGGMIGAGYGAVLGPLAAWLLMRHVPLGIAIGGTMLGTLAGGVAGLALDTHYFTLPLAGFALSALVIRFAVPRRARVAG